MNQERKKHWETVYETKTPNEVSWTQETPRTSLELIRSFNIDKSAQIIDVGGGDSKLVDYLLEDGYENVTVLDISEKALLRAQKRLGDKASKVTWIASDVTDFNPDTTFDVWHDRATFHFLTERGQIDKYKKIVSDSVVGYLAIGTFSKDGPLKCSGLEITQYNEGELTSEFADYFELLESVIEDHTTPFDTTQNFLFCSFKKV